MSVKIYDTMTTATSNFPLAYAEKINIVKEDGSEADIQTLYNNGELSGGDTSLTVTEAEFLALPEEDKLNNSYYLYDIGVHYKNGVAYSRKKPIQLTMEEYKALGKVDPDQEYIVSADAVGILLEASDIGYSNAVSNLPCTTVQGAIDKVNANLGELSKNIDLTSKVVISPNLTPEHHRVIRNNNVVMVTGRIKVDTALVKDDIIFSGLPKLQETSMYLDAALFDHIPDIASGYVRLNSDGSIVADNAIQPGLYRFSLCYITTD